MILFDLRNRPNGLAHRRPVGPTGHDQSTEGTTTVPCAVTTEIGGSHTRAALARWAGSARQVTAAVKATPRLRRPTRSTVAVTSMTSPARTGARKLTSS